jgi:hypothetical protein
VNGYPGLDKLLHNCTAALGSLHQSATMLANVFNFTNQIKIAAGGRILRTPCDPARKNEPEDNFFSPPDRFPYWEIVPL